MKVILIIILISGAFISLSAQTPTPAKTPTDAEILRQKDEENRRVEQSFENLRKLNDRSTGFPKTYSITFPPPVTKLSKAQAERLLVEPEVSAQFAVFLKTPKTGLIKLFPDYDCESKYVVRAEEICQDLIPRSSTYSFRKENYSVREISDIRLKDNIFLSEGVLSHGIMVALGDIPVENILINSDGMKFLSDYKPAEQTNETAAMSKQLSDGIDASGYKYASTSPVLENTTYAIRVIAYKGSALNHAYGNFYYNMLEGDERIDITAVFRVVKKNKDGSLILLWKELARKDAPKLKTSKEDKEKNTIKPL